MGLCRSTSGSWFTCVKLSRFPFGVDTNEMAGPSTLHKEKKQCYGHGRSVPRVM